MLLQLPIDQAQQQVVTQGSGERGLAIEKVFEVILVQQWPDEVLADRPRQGALPGPWRSVQRNDHWLAHWHSTYRHGPHPNETPHFPRTASVRP